MKLRQESLEIVRLLYLMLSSSQTFLFLNLILNHHFLSQLLLHLQTQIQIQIQLHLQILQHLTLLILLILIQSEEQPKTESR